MPAYNLPPPPTQHHRLPSIHSSPIQTPPLPHHPHPQHIPVTNGQPQHPSPIPAPTPASTNPVPAPSANSKSVPELEAKYNRLKRKYFEMEDRMKDERREKEEAYIHLFRMQQERRAMLDRIAELETVPNSRQISSAYPSLLKPADLPPATVSRLRQALEGDDDHEGGRPPKASHHEPAPPREAESSKPPQPTAEIQFQHVAPTTASGTKRRSRRKAQQPYEQQVSLKEETPNPTIVSAGGTRLKIKPPAQPTETSRNHSRQESMGPPPNPSSEVHSPTNSVQHENLMDRSGGTSTPQSQARGTPAPPTPRVSNQRSTKPKRLKAHTVTAKTSSVPMIPRDPQTGTPILPLSVGIMTVISLGEICPREHFHTERYIFPVGYEVTRRYLSTVDPNIEVTYHCKILEGTGGPIFQIKAPDIDVVEAGSATGAWSGIVKTANGIRSRQHSNSVSGPDYFGLGQSTIKHLIQGLPGANQLRDYVWQKYVEGGPMGGRHATVVPAVFDDNEDVQGGKSPKSDIMDVDGEVDEQDVVPEVSEEVNGSEQKEREEDRSIPPVVPRSFSKSRAVSVHSPPARSIPSSMASLLNSYPAEYDDNSLSRSAGENSEPSGCTRLSPFKAALVARDISGRPLLPLEIPHATLIKLGEISSRDGYHTSRSIYPVGYELNRVWMSSVDSTMDDSYNCQILEGTDGPVFQVTPESRPEDSVRKGDPSEAWAPFVMQAASIRKQALGSSDKGEEYFGLLNDTIRSLIQELPRARELPNYEWKNNDGS